MKHKRPDAQCPSGSFNKTNTDDLQSHDQIIVCEEQSERNQKSRTKRCISLDLESNSET